MANKAITLGEVYDIVDWRYRELLEEEIKDLPKHYTSRNCMKRILSDYMWVEMVVQYAERTGAVTDDMDGETYFAVIDDIDDEVYKLVEEKVQEEINKQIESEEKRKETNE